MRSLIRWHSADLPQLICNEHQSSSSACWRAKPWYSCIRLRDPCSQPTNCFCWGRFFTRAAKPAEVCLWKFWWNMLWNSIWNFKFPDGKNLVRFWGTTFLPARKAQKLSGRISGRISEQISEQIFETSFRISRLFSETSFSRWAVLKICLSKSHVCEENLLAQSSTL